MHGIELSNVNKKFDEVVAVDSVSISIERGEFATLLGPSGCGKTTTLRCVAGLEKPDSGQISLAGEIVEGEGRSTPTPERSLGMVFQSYAVWPHMTVFDNVAFPLQVKKISRSEIEKRVANVLARVGLAELGERYPAQLSGGQQQRVAVARALVGDPRAILYDEPLSNLDAKLRDEMRAELRDLHDRLDITALYVTHDQQEAMALSDSIHVMEAGAVVQSGPPEFVYNNPATVFVCRFLGAANVYGLDPNYSMEPGGGRSGGLQTVTVRTDEGLVARTAIANQGRNWTHVGVRPHRIRVASGLDMFDDVDNCYRARVSEVVHLGDRLIYTLDVEPGVSMRAESVSGGEKWTPGQRVAIHIHPRDYMLM